jgi:hypothetical protein
MEIKKEVLMLRLSSYKLLIASLLAGPLVLGGGSLVKGGAPEPPGTFPGEQFAGHRVVVYIDLDGFTATVFAGECDGQPIPQLFFPDFPTDVANLTPEDIVDTRFIGATSSLPQCFARRHKQVNGDLVVVDVKDFFTNGTKVVAKIVLRALVPAA